MNKLNRITAMTGLSIAAIFGSTAMAAPSVATTGSSDNDFKFSFVSKDFSYGEASFSIENRQRLTVGGAEQLTWWYPNHNVKVTDKAIRNAPYIKVRYAACAKQSKSIAKQAHGANIVVAKVGSVICNTGKNGGIVGGFKWKVTKGPAVLKWNQKLKLYEHLYNLVLPKKVQPGDEVVGYMTFHGKKYAIVKVCRNRMGGKVDKMYDKVVQVRYAEDVKESGDAVAKAYVGGTATYSVTCPSGANFNVKVTTEALALASSSIDFTERTRVSALATKKFELEQSLRSDGDAKALAKAETKIEASGSCGDTPPPKEDTPPSMTCTGMQHVFYGEDRSAFDFDATDADGDAISFGEPVVTGPISVVTVERSGNRLVVWIVAQEIPSGTSAPASVRVEATAGGKKVGCTVNTTVENNHTGW